MTPRGVEAMEARLARFGPDNTNAVMIDRLRRISCGELQPIAQDLNFYTHELRESVRYKRIGHRSGDPGYDVWNTAHTATLEDYGLSELTRPHPLFHPSTLEQ